MNNQYDSEYLPLPDYHLRAAAARRAQSLAIKAGVVWLSRWVGRMVSSLAQLAQSKETCGQAS